MKILKYLFYRFYDLMVSVGNGDIAVIASILFFTMMLGINYATLESIFYVITGSRSNLFPQNKIIMLILMACLALVLYFLFVWDGKIIKLLELYKTESKKRRIEGRTVVILYIVLSIFLFMFSLYLMIKRNRGEFN